MRPRHLIFSVVTILISLLLACPLALAGSVSGPLSDGIYQTGKLKPRDS